MCVQMLSLNAAVVKQVVYATADWLANRSAAGEASRRVGEPPPPARWCRKKGVFQSFLLHKRQRPWALAAHKPLECRVVTAPRQSKITRIVIKKTLVAKSGMVWIWLVKNIRATAGGALNHCGFNVGLFAHACAFVA